MAKKSPLSRQDIANLIGITRSALCQQIKRGGQIPFPRLPGLKQDRWEDTPKIRAWCKARKEKKAQQAARPRVTRAQRLSRRRAEKISGMVEILRNRTPVHAKDKALAFFYFCAVHELWLAKKGSLFHEPALLEGVHAYLARVLSHGFVLALKFGDMEKIRDGILALPTLPLTERQAAELRSIFEGLGLTTPQTEQSS
jgi:hypothetical protein